MLEMGLAKIYPFIEFEVSSITRSRFTEGGLKFKNSVPGPWSFGKIFLSVRWDLAGSIHIPNLKFLASPAPKIRHMCLLCHVQWLDARGGVPKLQRGSPGLKFKNSVPGPWSFGKIFLSVRWDLPGSIHIPNLKFLASPAPKIRRMCLLCHVQWLDARGGVPKLARGSPSFFYRTPTKYSRMVSA